MTRLSRLKLSARLCNLGLNPNAARPLARFLSRLSRTYVQTFQTQTVGANLQFGSKSGCSATLARLISTLSRSYVQTFPTRTLGATLQFGSKSECGATLGISCPDCPELMCRLSRHEMLAQICSLDLNPDAARSLARLMSRLSRPYDQTFQTQIVGENLQFGTKSGCGATLGTTHVQTFQTLCPDFPDANSWRESAIWV